jgi:hypothetical protein
MTILFKKMNKRTQIPKKKNKSFKKEHLFLKDLGPKKKNGMRALV